VLHFVETEFTVYMRCVVGSLVLARFRPDVVEVHEVQDRLFAQVWKNYISVHTSTDRCTGSSRYEYEERRSLPRRSLDKKQPYRLVKTIVPNGPSSTKWTPLQGLGKRRRPVDVWPNHGHKWQIPSSVRHMDVRQFLGHQSFPDSR
jgi:hypothetical protein